LPRLFHYPDQLSVRPRLTLQHVRAEWCHLKIGADFLYDIWKTMGKVRACSMLHSQ
jgi:hypothetical protein